MKLVATRICSGLTVRRPDGQWRKAQWVEGKIDIRTEEHKGLI